MEWHKLTHGVLTSGIYWYPPIVIDYTETEYDEWFDTIY